MNLLLIEDDDQFAYGLQMNLEVEGFTVMRVRNGEDGLRILEACSPDIVILDLLLPDVTGFEILKRVRESGNDVPMIVLSALSDEIDRVLAFRLGADDYVTKPFGLMELLERIKLRARRIDRTSRAGEMSAGPIRLCKSSERLYIRDVEVALRPKEFGVLSVLMSGRGSVVTKEELLRVVWRRTTDYDTRTVDQHVRQLRRKFRTFGIETAIRIIPARGFAFSLE